MLNIKQVGLWGDSIMKGILWNRECQKYRHSCVYAAESAAEELGLTLENHAKMGCTSTKGLTLLKKQLEKNDAPSAALIEFGGNDSDFHWNEIALEPNGIHQPNTPPDVFEAQMRSMIAYLRAKGIYPVLTTLVPNHAERYFSFITRDGLNGDHILQWLGDVQHIYRWHESYHARIEKIAREEKCMVIGLRDAFLDYWHYEDLLCDDGIHPNERGYRLIEEVLCTEGRRLLRIG